MLSERPYRKRLSLGDAAAQLSWLSPSELECEVVHALLVQLRYPRPAIRAQPWFSCA